MTTLAPPRPSTSTARRRSKSRLVDHRPLPDFARLWCDRCDRLRVVAITDWLCRPCRRGGAR